MATLLVALAVMAVLMSAVLPAWRHQATREKEAELVFRGEQYVRAIQLWERKMGPGSRPPTVDILVQQRFLRKKYKDPVTDGDFQLVYAGVNPTPNAPAGRGQPPPSQQPPPQQQGQIAGGGIHGVQSKSRENSIRIYKGATRYSEWRFIHAGAANQPGGRGGSARPGGRGGSPVPGGRGIDGRGRQGFPGETPGPGRGGPRGGGSPFGTPFPRPGGGRQ